MKTTTSLWIAAGVLFAVVAGVAVYKVWPLLNPRVAEVAPLDPDCDLRAGPCAVRLEDGTRISFAIEPREIPVVQPLTLDVAVEGRDVLGVEVDFTGVDMNMGFNRPRLEPSGAGRYSGGGMLPVCVRGAMEWEARVLVRTDEGLVAAPFRFITVKPGAAFPDE